MFEDSSDKQHKYRVEKTPKRPPPPPPPKPIGRPPRPKMAAGYQLPKSQSESELVADGSLPMKQHNIGSIRSSSGLIMVINTILLFLNLLLAINWRIRVTRENKKHYEDIDELSLYFIGSLLTPFIVFLIIYLKQICELRISMASFLASVLMFIFCFITAILLFVSAGFIIPEVNSRFCSDRRACTHLKGTLAMGILTGVGIFGQSIAHITERNKVTFI